MDLAANDLEKTSAVERETMVSKLHNMQWLKKTSSSTSLVKVKPLCKQRSDHDEDDKVKDKVLAVEDSKANSAEETCEHHLTMDACMKDLSNEPVTESDGNLCEKDIDTSNMLLNGHSLIMQKVEEGASNMAVQENLTTAQPEIQCHIDKEEKHQESVSQDINIPQDESRNVECPSTSELQKINDKIKEPDLTEHADKNNNNDKSVIHMQDMQEENTPKSSENDKASTETKDKDTYMKKTNILKTNIKNASNTTLSKCCNDKPSTSVNPKRPNLSKSPMTNDKNDKNGKAERVTNKHPFTKKNSCARDEPIKQHSCVPTKGIENKAKDVAAKSVSPKTDLEKEPNKTADINQSDQGAHLSCTPSLNKDKTLQIHQRTTAKQFTPKPKGAEFSRSNTSSSLNRFSDKSKVMEKTAHIPKSSDSSLYETEKKNSDKNVSNDRKPYIASKGTTFFANKNSTSKFAKGYIGHAPAYGRNPLYARNNATPDKDRAGNTEYRAVSKVKKDCLLTDTLPNANTRTEELCASNLEADKKQQCEKNRDAQSVNVHKTDVSVLNNENNINLMEDTKPASVEDRAKQISATPEQSCKSEEAIDNTRVDTDQSTDANNKVDNEEFKPSRDSFGLDKSYAGPQIYSMSPHIFRPEDMQQMDANQTKNNAPVWNDLSDSSRRNISAQHSVENIHSPQQTIVQAETHMRQTPLREMDRFYDQCLPMNDTTRLSQIPSIFDAPSYEYVQTTLGDSDSMTMFGTINSNRENSNMSQRYTPNGQQKSFTPLSDLSGHSMTANQVNRWNLSQDGFHHVEQLVNPTQPATMHVYSAAAFGQDDFNGAQVPNCLPGHMLYTPYTPWNSQLLYSAPLFHNPPCTSYTVLPNVASQSSNYNDVNVAPMSMCIHEQPQHRYFHYVPANSNTAMQMHANPSYAKGTYGCDLNNCALETRNSAIDDGPTRPNRYYKRYQDNCRTAYDVPSYTTPALQPISRPQQQSSSFAAVNQYNVYGIPGQKYCKQNATSFMQPSPSSPKGQKTQDLVCEDSSEDIPPIISPKEFMTNNSNFSNRSDQFAPRMFKPDFKMRPNTGYRQHSFQRYNGGFRKNTYQDFPREYTSSIGAGRGYSKISQNSKM